MHYAVRLNIKGALDGTTGLKKGATIVRESVIDIAVVNAPLGLLDLTPIQAPPADKPLYLQSIGVSLKAKGMKGIASKPTIPRGGPSFVLVDLLDKDSLFDSTGWLLPVGYMLRIFGPSYAFSAAELADPDADWAYLEVRFLAVRFRGASPEQRAILGGWGCVTRWTCRRRSFGHVPEPLCFGVAHR